MSDLRTPSAAGVGRLLRRGGARAPRALPRTRRPGRPRARTLVLLALAAVLLTAGWFWLRDSSLVAVRDVQITGLTGGQEAEIRGALEEAAVSMTTLRVREDALRTAVAPFSIVKEIEVATDFPRGMRIHVVSNVAVGAVDLDGRATPVTADGTLLRDVSAAPGLASVPLRGTPAGSRLKDAQALAALAALGAAPPALRARVESVATTSERGLELQLSDGPAIWFGDGERLLAKWAAAAAVIADPAAAGASYVDVSAPTRPAVGGLPGGVPATGESGLPESPAGTAVDPATGAPIAQGTASGTAAGADASAVTGAGTPAATAETAP